MPGAFPTLSEGQEEFLINGMIDEFQEMEGLENTDREWMRQWLRVLRDVSPAVYWGVLDLRNRGSAANFVLPPGVPPHPTKPTRGRGRGRGGSTKSRSSRNKSPAKAPAASASASAPLQSQSSMNILNTTSYRATGTNVSHDVLQKLELPENWLNYYKDMAAAAGLHYTGYSYTGQPLQSASRAGSPARLPVTPERTPSTPVASSSTSAAGPSGVERRARAAAQNSPYYRPRAA